MSKVEDLFLEVARGSQRKKAYSVAAHTHTHTRTHTRTHTHTESFCPIQLFHKYTSFFTGVGLGGKTVNILTQIHPHYGKKKVSQFGLHSGSIFRVIFTGSRPSLNLILRFKWKTGNGFFPIEKVSCPMSRSAGALLSDSLGGVHSAGPLIQSPRHTGLSGSSGSFPFLQIP